jgi:hypothetical protein
MGKLLRGLWLWVVAFSHKPIPKPWRIHFLLETLPPTPSYLSSPFPPLYRDWNGDDRFVRDYLVQALIVNDLRAEVLRKKRNKRRKYP